MATIFRFAIQTHDRRLSEVWSFFCNKGEACLYATRTSMRGWLKVSFHQSGACHIKSYDSQTGPRGEKDFAWTYPNVSDSVPTHAMRVIYDIKKQTADFPFSDQVKILFDEWKGSGSVYLDTFFALADKDIVVDEVSGIVAAYRLEGRRWVYFTVRPGPPQNELPERISGMTFHLGESDKESNATSATLKNSTAVWYSVPESSGTLVIVEASFARFPLL